MPNEPDSDLNELQLVGELARIRLRMVIHVPDRRSSSDSPDFERHMMLLFSDEAEEVHGEVTAAVRGQLGVSANVEVEPLVVRRGNSIEVLIILTALGTFLGTYNQLIEATTKTVELTRRIVARTAARLSAEVRPPGPGKPSMDVTASWTLGSAVQGRAIPEAPLGSAPTYSTPASHPNTPAQPPMTPTRLMYVITATLVINLALLSAIGGILLARS